VYVSANDGRFHKILMVVFKSLFVSMHPGYLKELFIFRNSSYPCIFSVICNSEFTLLTGVNWYDLAVLGL